MFSLRGGKNGIFPVLSAPEASSHKNSLVGIANYMICPEMSSQYFDFCLSVTENKRFWLVSVILLSGQINIGHVTDSRLFRVQCSNSKADEFLIDDFLRCDADIIHRTDPCYLIICFQLLCDSLRLYHLLYQHVQLLVGRQLDRVEGVRQLPGGLP